MEQRAKVISGLPGGNAKVAVVRQSACSGDCHKCSGCGAAEQTLVFTARNPIGARPGDVVTVESATGPVLKAAAVLYLLPLLLFIAGYLLGMQWNLGGLIGTVAFGLSVGLVIAYDRLVVKRQNTEYTIIRKIKEGS